MVGGLNPRPRSHRRLAVVCLAFPLLLAAGGPPALAEIRPGDAGRLQALLYNEILFHARQGDYVSALTRWQVAAEQGLLPALPAESELLLARLKLAYGMDVEAGLDFTRLMTADLPPAASNRAWYELARSFFHKGYPEAAMEALDQVTGAVDDEIAGDLRLLRAHVLMALQRHLEAAQALADWQGPAELAPYADYNRGIALVRAGRDADAVEALQGVATLPAQAEEALALRDKANLTLGYVFLRQGAFERARSFLQQVRLNSPYSNRALLAMGWIAQQQGRTTEALSPWTELRHRNVTDPAVQESLLAVPSLHRELQALGVAAAQYEDAVAVYSGELGRIGEAVEALQQGQTLDLLGDKAAADGTPRVAGARYFGPLLASRRFQQTLQGHGDLQLMLDTVDDGLQHIDRLADSLGVGPGTGRATGGAPGQAPDAGGARETAAPGRRIEGPGAAAPGALPPAPEWVVEWQGTDPAGEDFRGIPLLPEIDLPADRVLDPRPEPQFRGLPEPDYSGLPAGPEFLGLPSGPVDIGLPQSDIAWLPETGRFRLPERRDEQYAYPDARPGAAARATNRERQRRRIREPAARPGGAVDDRPPGEALQALAAELAAAAGRMASLPGERLQSPGGDSDLAARIAALRARILALRARIAAAIADYESYTRALALAELQARQRQLEGYLEQARLELAKTYDQATER